jgi:hypothetical protein
VPLSTFRSYRTHMESAGTSLTVTSLAFARTLSLPSCACLRLTPSPPIDIHKLPPTHQGAHTNGFSFEELVYWVVLDARSTP